MLEPSRRLLTLRVVTTVHITADDRSGAMEAAAFLADAGWRTVVCSWDGETAEADCTVTDLRSRHVSAAAAIARLGVAERRSGPVRMHKIDSTLRGNWPAEVALLAGRSRVVMIPAYPDAGRTCENGVVLVDGVPVDRTEFANDPVTPVVTARPADLLGAASVHSAGELSDWFASVQGGTCVCDARTEGDVRALVSLALGQDDAVLCGTAAVAGAIAAERTVGRPPAPVLPPGPVVVVCGSRHPRSVAQADAVEGCADVTVVRPPAGLRADPEVVALELAGRAHDEVQRIGASLVVLLGGDTAEAFVGERPVSVLGSVGSGVRDRRGSVGMAVGIVGVGGRAVRIVTKPGGFGDDRSVLDLLTQRGAS